MPIPSVPISGAGNPQADKNLAYGPEYRAILSENGLQQAYAAISAWPDYNPTPLLRLSGLADALGVAKIYYKDEASRFGLGSFKALGGAYAVARLLSAEICRRQGLSQIAMGDLLAGRFRSISESVTVSCATDGNHGRSVAWGARLFGCQCVVYIHATVSAGREQAIRAYGAQLVRTQGNYDDSVRIAAADAERLGRFVVSDTSYPGYVDIPKDVMQGYTVMVAEALEQLPGAELPTHVFVPGGVGAVAAAVGAVFWQRFGAHRPLLIVVEPNTADCILQSVSAGRRVSVTGDLQTIMAGLSCGEVSLLAWPILRHGCDAVLAVADQAARDCMRLLADGVATDKPLVAGESAVAGLAGLVGALQDKRWRRKLELGPDSRVLLFGTEGATDPVLYRRIVGRSAEQVAALA